MAPGVIVRVPNENPKFVPLPEELLSCDVEEVGDKLREELCSAFGWEAETDMRVLFQERDLEDEEKTVPAFLKALSLGQPCFIRVLFRLLGGKGGFGALLRKQGRGKKTTNFDAMRDLSGRRLRHSKAVDRIKEWMEKKKQEDELVRMLTGEGPEMPKPTPASESLDPAFIERMKRTSAAQPALVRAGMKKLDAGEATVTKRPRVHGEGGGGENWLSGLDALGTLSSPSSEPEGADNGQQASRTEAAKDKSSAAPVGTPSPIKCPKAHSCLRMTENPDEPGYEEAACCDLCDHQDLPGTLSHFYHCATCEYDVCPKCAEQPASSSSSSAAAASSSAAASGSSSSGSSAAAAVASSAPAAAATTKSPAKVTATASSAGSSAAAAEAPPAAKKVPEAAEDDGRIIKPNDLANFATAEELAEKVPAEVLKRSLQKLGLKCSGKPEDRAARLFLLKTTKLGALPKAHFAAAK